MKTSLTQEELTQLRKLVSEAQDSEKLQESADISYMESIDLINKLNDMIDETQNIVEDNENKILSNNVLLVDGEKVGVPDDFDFEKAEIGYRIESREEIIENLYSWIAEANGRPDQQSMKDDLQYLLSIEDEYVFSSYSTNEYIAVSDDRNNFNTILKEIKEAIVKF